MAHVITERHFICFTSSDVGQVVGGSVVVPAAPVAGDAEVRFDFGPVSEHLPAQDRRKKFALWRVEVMRATGVSATDYQPQVYDATGAATTAWATKYLGALTLETARFDVTSIDAPLYTSTAGYLFFKVNGDAADTFNYAVWFEVLG
jgi:hypothetical protein